jgi:hypothetical protein
VAVPIVLAIRLVVLVLIGDEVFQRIAVVGSQEVDGSPRLSAAFIEKVR